EGEQYSQGFRFEEWWLNDAEFLDIVSRTCANHNFNGSANTFLGGLVGCASDLSGALRGLVTLGGN
ncbi:hypothetical protein PanWU01x14_294250, partial [Parasponia andersonii]